MKKRFMAGVLVMAVWAAGFYSWGRHDGVAKGKMEIPSVQISWPKKDEPKSAEVKAPETDYVSISNAACESDELRQLKQ